MTAHRWVVTDVTNQVYQSELIVEADQVENAPDGLRIVKRTRQGGLADGVDEIRVHNGQFEFSILPTRGMGLWRGWLGDQPVGWQSPVRGPIHPRFVPLHEPSGLGWLDGFDEWICRCGASSNGAPDFDPEGRLVLPLHGRLANLPAHRVEIEIDDDQIIVRGVIDECRFHFQKLRLTTTITTRFNQLGVDVHDEVRNLSASPGEMQMLYHCNFGPPWLGAGSELVLPAETVVPRNDEAAQTVGHWSTFSAPTPATTERVYFLRMLSDPDQQTVALLKNANGQRGISLTWNVEQLPCFTLWKNETAESDGYVTGLEPGTNYPNPRSFEAEHGRLIKLAPEQSHEMNLGFTIHPDAESVRTVEQRVDTLRAGRTAKVWEQTLPDWCG